CDEKALEDSLCKRVIVTPDGNITKPLDPASAVLSRDAMAKTIVDKINSSIGQDPTATSIIGLQDQQLCINLTNEKLQQHFNQHVFKMEQEESTREEINWSYVEFVDNQDVLDLIEKSTHETFAQKMYQTYKVTNASASRNLLEQTSQSIIMREMFLIIEPFCEQVTYQAEQFLDKNKDYVVAEHQALLDASSLLLRRECCSFSNGEYVKAGLQELEQWCRKASDQFAGSSWDELRHIRQAVWFLVSHQKAQKSLEEITNELCPVSKFARSK
ncbi:hypothetical protein NC653_002533, partial [Populus alba x Populus x berolinensis]